MELKVEEIKNLTGIFPGNCAVYKLNDGILEFLMSSEGMEEVGHRAGQVFLQDVQLEFCDRVFQNDRRFLREAVEQALQHGSAECVYRFGHEERDEFTWVHTFVKYIGELADSPVLIMTFRDAAESNQAQLELLEDMDTIVYVCDVETQELLYANRAAVKNSQQQSSYSGHKCYNYMFGKNCVCEDCQLKHLQMDGKQELVRHDSENDRYLNIEKKGISWYGRLACAHFINDVTEKKRNERMLAMERETSAKAAFVSNVSHDMRTPLNGILGFTELAMQSKGNDKRAEYLEKIRTTGKFMLNLINETLDLAKITSGKLEVEPENCNIQNVLDTIVVSAYANAEVKGVEFITELEGLHFTDVYVDVLKLQKVILNLLSNAVKYTPAGGKVTMLMEGPQDFGDGYNCHIAIVDTGLGMEKNFLPRLFEPFAQERSKLTRKIEGTGLGMSIVKQLVDLLGGKIAVDSEPGKGTRFDLWLNLPPGKEMAADDTAANNYPELAGMKVLLCEDNEINRELVQNLLSAYGVEVLSAADGQKGVAIFANSPKDSIDVILMDVRMPIMDGLEATRAIRAMSREDARYVPIFGLTGDVDEASVAQAKAAGMDECLPKPVDIPQMLGKLSAALHAKGES